MHILHYIGIDISKATLDWATFEGKATIWQTTTPNTVAVIRTALLELKKLPGWQPQQTVFCMEHTGIVRHEVARFEYG
ncbi:IS110 family transposase [Spirosoma utsteinense]|uniref:Transposase IS111A/IS1328/IS1533 N-terminal domain-containing protein n=1 Tax=Spirosoma utsteinense TaxID=2585773 RepID=A0ABR6WFN7_9BACT|nr:IS110 family transposase [Spirosoma utsteinense]MBC3789171.1 hypothetical protein [Spirosoma utsteinense]MBC3795094.1 hypothetical protein [Spirosoma utsteinense]